MVITNALFNFLKQAQIKRDKLAHELKEAQTKLNAALLEEADPLSSEDIRKIEQLETAIKKNPRDLNAYLKLADLMVKLNRMGEAVKPLGKAAKLNPKDPAIQFKLGDIYFKLQHYQDALGPFNQAVRLNPKYAEAHYKICKINELVGNEEVARKHYQVAIKINPDIEYQIEF